MQSKHIKPKQMLCYVMNEISSQEKRMIDRHLASCPDCKARLAEEIKLFSITTARMGKEPDQKKLETCRLNLRERLRYERFEKERKNRSWSSLRDFLPEYVPTRKLIGATIILLIGIFIGRLNLSSHSQLPQDAAWLLRNAKPIGGIQIIPAAGPKDKIKIRFNTIQENVFEGDLQDADIQYLLSYALINATRDNTRLTSINLLKKIADQEQIQNSLMYTLENDKNPGIRLKAIKLLKSLPMNESVKNILIQTLFNDPNAGIQIEAADALHELDDPDVIPLLEKKAQEDDYTKSLLTKNNSI